MTTKYSAGPWKFDNHSPSMPVLGIYAADNKGPWHHERSQEEQAANCRLIAAAPELLEALEVSIDALNWVIEQAGGPKCEHEAGVCFCKENNALNVARAAIQKATGESHGQR
jgi:hypothetical protein